MISSRESRQKIFNRRSSFVFGAQALLFTVLAGRLTFLQILQSDRYKTLANENRIRARLIAPARGQIFERTNLKLAYNTDNYSILIIPEEAGNIKKTLGEVSKIITLPATQQKKILKEISRAPVFRPVLVSSHLKWREVSRIEVNRLNIPGIFIRPGKERIYPQGNIYAHIIGFVAQPNAKEVKKNRLFSLPGFHIGKSGVEKFYDDSLRGKGGGSYIEVNSKGRPLKEVRNVKASAGKNIYLSLDNRLQDYLTQRLSGSLSSAAVLMDIHTGEVLSLASFPNFDPNKFVVGIDNDEWQELLNNPYKPLINKAVSGLYAPGSTFKPIVTLAALEKNIPTWKTHFCPGSIQFADRRFYCWASWGHKKVNMNKALRNSCDIWFYRTSLELGIERIANYSKMLGLGVKTNIDLDNEKAGIIPNKAWKRKHIGSSWQHGETMISGIGQGYITSTPLQLAVLMSRLVNGGYAVEPRITLIEDALRHQIINENYRPFAKIPVKDKNLEIIKRALFQVVNHPQGTAYQTRAGNSKWHFGGKTGTSQVKNITEGERETGVIGQSQLPWKNRDHALFIGYAPAIKPRWAVSVVVEHGGSGSGIAAPIARDILVKTQRLFKT